MSTRVGSKVRGRALRGTLTVSVAAAALLAVALPAHAQSDDTCTPKAAWTETIPAQGEPTILVDNPDYSAPKYTTVQHDEQTSTTTTYLRYSWNPKGDVAKDNTPDKSGSTPLNDPDHSWTANTSNYDGAGHGTDPLDQAFYVSNANGQGNGSWFYWKTITSGETIPAYDEQVLVCPGKGEPKIEKANPDYKPASTVEHPAVVCTATPKPSPTATTPALAATGSNASTIAIIAAVLALLGTAVTLVTRRLAASRH